MSVQNTDSSTARYRVKARRDELEMLWNTGEQDVPTELIGLSMDGVSFFVAKDSVGDLQPGDICAQTFYDMLSGLKVQVIGVIVECFEEESTYRVDVVFSDTDSLTEQLEGSDSWRHFNRREHYRVHPRLSHCRRSKIDLQWRGHQGSHVLHDVSARGLSIRLASYNDLQVPRERPVRARMMLPNSTKPLEMVLRWNHEEQVTSHRRIGFMVDPMRTPYFSQVEDRLVAAVLEWQRRAIQVASTEKAKERN